MLIVYDELNTLIYIHDTWYVGCDKLLYEDIDDSIELNFICVCIFVYFFTYFIQSINRTTLRCVLFAKIVFRGNLLFIMYFIHYLCVLFCKKLMFYLQKCNNIIIYIYFIIWIMYIYLSFFFLPKKNLYLRMGKCHFKIYNEQNTFYFYFHKIFTS